MLICLPTVLQLVLLEVADAYAEQEADEADDGGSQAEACNEQSDLHHRWREDAFGNNDTAHQRIEKLWYLKLKFFRTGKELNNYAILTPPNRPHQRTGPKLLSQPKESLRPGPEEATVLRNIAPLNCQK